MGVPVFVLQPFAVQRGPSRGRAEQEAARTLIARRPGQIADALQAEHRVENVERDRDAVGMAVRGGRRYPRGERSGLVDAFLEDLPLLVLDRKSTRLNSSHLVISYAVFCLKKKK